MNQAFWPGNWPTNQDAEGPLGKLAHTLSGT